MAGSKPYIQEKRIKEIEMQNMHGIKRVYALKKYKRYILFLYIYAFLKKSTYICIEQGQGHILQGLHMVVGEGQDQGPQEIPETGDSQGHQNGNDHPPEGHFVRGQGHGHQDMLLGGHHKGGHQQKGQGHLLGSQGHCHMKEDIQ